MRHIILGLSLIAGPLAATGQTTTADGGLALVVGNADYATFNDVPNAASLATTGSALGTMGYTIFGGRDLDADALLRQAETFAADLSGVDRSLAVLSGQFVTDDRNSWFVSTQAPRPGPISAGRAALPIEPLVAAMAATDGPAIVMLGVFPEQADYGQGVRSGLGSLDVPEGVTVITGNVWTIERLLEQLTAEPGADPVALARANPDLAVQQAGDDAPVQGGSTTGATAAPRPQAPVELPDDMGSLDDASAWTAAASVDTEESYARYLDRFPGGANVATAVARLAELRRTPANPDAAAETALALDLQARQGIQRDLTVLGYDTRGIDGIFGAGTRGAISSWQARTGVRETGYITAEQIPALRAEARARSAELEAQAAQRRAEQERRDRALWQQTRAANTQAAYRDYLDQFPDGLEADAAREAVEAIRLERQQQASAQDRAAWDEARQRNAVPAYRAYLDRPGDGQFDEEARARIETLQAEARPNPAQQREAQLGMDPITLQLVESRLQAEGLDPGPVDGQLDGDSRRAIRRYQRDRGLTVTGFLDQATVSRMLVDAIR